VSTPDFGYSGAKGAFVTEHAMQPGYDYADEFEYASTSSSTALREPGAPPMAADLRSTDRGARRMG
jgi:hypothetical protein